MEKRMRYIGMIEDDIDLLKRTENLVIFGAGLWGQKTYKYLFAYNPHLKISCFLDNNHALWNQKLFEIPILQPEKALLKYPNADYIIASKYAKEIALQLIKNRISPMHITTLYF